MAPQLDTAGRLVGRSLLIVTSVFASLGVFLFGFDQGVMSGQSSLLARKNALACACELPRVWA